MAIEHDAILDASLHEPKGVASASSGEVYVADGSGSGDWATLSSNISFTYGGIYSDTASPGESVTGISTTRIVLDAFTANTDYNGVTPDYTTGELTVSTAGVYYIEFSASFATQGAGDAGVYEFRVNVNDVEQYIAIHREMSGTADTGSGNCHGLLTLAANDVLNVYIESDEASGTDNLYIRSASLTAYLVRAT